MATSQRNKPTRKKASPEEALERYHDVFEEIHRFVELIHSNDEELKEAEAKLTEAKLAYEAAKQVVAEIRDLREGAKHGLFRYLAPSDGGEVLPLFDRMEPPDEEKHGVNANEWRQEPIAALRLSLPAQMALTDGEILLVGQLQDRVLAKPDDWWKDISGLNFGIACAVVDRLNDFINERSTR